MQSKERSTEWGKRGRHSGTYRTSALTRVSVRFTWCARTCVQDKGPATGVRRNSLGYLAWKHSFMFWKRDRNRRWTTLFRGRERCRCTMFAVKIIYCQVTMEFVENAGNARYYLYLSNLVKKMEWVFFVFNKYRTFVGDFVKISQEGIAMCSNVWNVWNVRFPIKVQLYSQA